MMVDRFERGGRAGDIEGDFSRVHFKCEIHILLLEHIENRRPTVGEVLKACLDLTGHDGRKGINQVPN